MFNSMNHQSTSGDGYSSDTAKPIATGIIVHGSNRDRAAGLCRSWQYLMHHLLRGNEPRIWQKRNAAGEVFYHSYDPCSRRSIGCTSETELRVWLEQLPYC